MSALPQSEHRPSGAERAAPGASPAVKSPLSMAEVIERYPREWILMRVTAFDEQQWPSHGHVLAHSPARAAITARLAEEPIPAVLSPDQPCYVFKANLRARSGPEFDAAMDTLVEQIRNVQAASRARRER